MKNRLQKADIIMQNQKIQVSGNLDFSNVMSVYEKSLPLAEQAQELIFDFTQVISCNSAGLALMIEWIKLAQQLRKPVQFLHLPHTMTSLANAAGMAEIVGNITKK